MIHSVILLFILTWNLVNSKVTDLIVTDPKEGNTYRIGEKVSLVCIVEEKGDLSVLFRREKIVAENGHSFISRYSASHVVDKSTFKFTLTIEKLEWNDHGIWECIHDSTSKVHKIAITVPGTVEPLKSELDYASVDKRQSNEFIPQILYGKGIKTNPFDLTRKSKVKLVCRTGCSYPQSNHKWFYNNFTNPRKPIVSFQSTISNCTLFDKAVGFNTESSVLIGCDEFQMVGSNEVTCKMHESNESQSVFVLCPGGHKPWTLTNGEIIGLSVAIGLAALMLVLFFMSAKKIVNSYRYGSVAGGIRV